MSGFESSSMPSLISKQFNPLTEPKGHNMSTTHYLAHTHGMSRTDLYIDVEATDSTGSDFTYRLEGEMETDTRKHDRDGFELTLHGISCVAVKDWDELELDEDIGKLWAIRNDRSNATDEERNELEEAILAKMQAVSVDSYGVWDTPSEWVADGMGIDDLADEVRSETDGSVDARVAAKIAELKAEAVRQFVVFESDAWDGLFSELMAVLASVVEGGAA